MRRRAWSVKSSTLAPVVAAHRDLERLVRRRPASRPVLSVMCSLTGRLRIAGGQQRARPVPARVRLEVLLGQRRGSAVAQLGPGRVRPGRRRVRAGSQGLPPLAVALQGPAGRYLIHTAGVNTPRGLSVLVGRSGSRPDRASNRREGPQVALRTTELADSPGGRGQDHGRATRQHHQLCAARR